MATLQEQFLPAAIFGAGAGAFGYVIGGVAAPYVVGVSAPVYAALGFLLAAAYVLSQAKNA